MRSVRQLHFEYTCSSLQVFLHSFLFIASVFWCLVPPLNYADFIGTGKRLFAVKICHRTSRLGGWI